MDEANVEQTRQELQSQSWSQSQEGSDSGAVDGDDYRDWVDMPDDEADEEVSPAEGGASPRSAAATSPASPAGGGRRGAADDGTPAARRRG